MCKSFFFYRRAASLARAINHLLVGEHGLVFGTPLHRRKTSFGKPVFEKFGEEPLRPLVVARVAGKHFFAPVERRAHRGELFAHARDVFIRPLLRVHAVLNGRVLGGKTECVEPYREKDVLSARTQESRVDIGDGEGVPMADMQVS